MDLVGKSERRGTAVLRGRNGGGEGAEMYWEVRWRFGSEAARGLLFVQARHGC